MDVQEVRCGGMGLNDLALDRDRLGGCCECGNDLRVP
jgi:hypothetical protein